jgi:cytosine deaminase
MNDEKFIELDKKIIRYEPDPLFPDDHFIYITCVEAMKAAKEGNFGVGAIIANHGGKIIERGHNMVFFPHFRSDLHAEMVILTRFEERHKELKTVEGYNIYTSLEPCPMCLARLIASGFKKVLYASPDPAGGMVSRMDQLPEAWKMLASGRIYGLADCAPALKHIAKEIFMITAVNLDKNLAQR